MYDSFSSEKAELIDAELIRYWPISGFTTKTLFWVRYQSSECAIEFRKVLVWRTSEKCGGSATPKLGAGLL